MNISKYTYIYIHEPRHVKIACTSKHIDGTVFSR